MDNKTVPNIFENMMKLPWLRKAMWRRRTNQAHNQVKQLSMTS